MDKMKTYSRKVQTGLDLGRLGSFGLLPRQTPSFSFLIRLWGPHTWIKWQLSPRRRFWFISGLVMDCSSRLRNQTSIITSTNLVILVKADTRLASDAVRVNDLFWSLIYSACKPKHCCIKIIIQSSCVWIALAKCSVQYLHLWLR